MSNFTFNMSVVPYKALPSTMNPHHKNGRTKSFVPTSKAPVEKWVHSSGKNVPNNKGNVLRGGNTFSGPKDQGKSKKYSYSNNYKGKNPITRTQW